MREWLKTLRKKKNYTMAKMADELGISESYYSLIEAGSRQERMDIALVTKISSILKVPISRIISFENDNASIKPTDDEGDTATP